MESSETSEEDVLKIQEDDADEDLLYEEIGIYPESSNEKLSSSESFKEKESDDISPVDLKETIAYDEFSRQTREILDNLDENSVDSGEISNDEIEEEDTLEIRNEIVEKKNPKEETKKPSKRIAAKKQRSHSESCGKEKGPKKKSLVVDAAKKTKGSSEKSNRKSLDRCPRSAPRSDFHKIYNKEISRSCPDLACSPRSVGRNSTCLFTSSITGYVLTNRSRWYSNQVFYETNWVKDIFEGLYFLTYGENRGFGGPADAEISNVIIYVSDEDSFRRMSRVLDEYHYRFHCPVLLEGAEDRYSMEFMYYLEKAKCMLEHLSQYSMEKEFK